MWRLGGTLTGYLVGVVVVFIVLNGLTWATGLLTRQRDFGIFSVGFIVGAIGMFIAAHLYGYRQMP